MRTITKADIEAYVLGCIEDPQLRKTIENARETDPAVERWFKAWDTESDLEIPAVFARQAEELTERYFREEGEREAGLLAPDSPFAVAVGQLIALDGGRLVYRAEVPRTMAADLQPRTMKAVEVPCIRPDFANRTLTVYQWASAVPEGKVRVSAVRLSPDKAESFPAVDYQLRAAKLPDGRAYWYKEVSLDEISPNLQPGDNVVFYVETAKP